MPTSRYTKGIAFASLIAILFLVAVWIWSSRPRDRSDRIEPAPTGAARLLELKHVGIGSLENMPNELRNDGAASVAAFAELSELLPADPLGPRNLAIVRIIVLQKTVDRQSAEFQQALRAAESALAEVKQREGESGIYHMLAAHLAALVGDNDRVVREYKSAAELMPDDYMPWSELYVYADDALLEDVAKEAAARAYEKQPNNIVLILEQLQSQAKDRDPAIVETLAGARSMLRLFEDYASRNGVQLSELTAEIVDKVRENDDAAWTTIGNRVRVIGNLIRAPNITFQLDRTRLRRHVLEYVIHEFDDGLAVSKGGELEQVETPIRLEPADSESQLPALTAVADAALSDFDLDGTVDVVVLTGDKILVYGRPGHGKTWELLSAAEAPLGAERILLADFDRDTTENASTAAAESCSAADLDVAVFGKCGASLFMNRLDPATGQRSLVLMDDPFAGALSEEVVSLAVADVDHDADLDVIAATSSGISIWSNNENWGFANISARSDTPASMTGITTITPVDWNRTVLTDLIVSGSAKSVGVLENVQHGRYRWHEFPRDLIDVEGIRDIAVAEVDGNPSWDLIACGPRGIFLSRTQIVEPGIVSPLAQSQVSTFPATGIETWDFDNDGALDLLAWKEDAIEVWRGIAGAQFKREPTLLTSVPSTVLKCEVGDVDADGDLDLLVVCPEEVIWYVNQGGNKNNWIDISLRAEESPKSLSQRCNLWGVGSLVELKAGSTYQAQTASRLPMHFGLGPNEKADVVRVLWTNGIPQNEIRPATRQTVCQEQRLLLGSCPYLYTWTGERFEFFTDLLWAAPLGLQVAEGVLAPWREWEYLLIPGDRLVAQDGEYRLQVTEELWEAAYFDTIRLIAVDHPADVDVYSNEKVGPAEIAEFKIHTVRNLLSPIAARDAVRRDVLDLIAQRDDRYVKLFEQNHKQGLTEEHFIELELGELDSPNVVKLLLTGWVFPTDPSINVAVSQNPNLNAPQPPSLWIPTASGEWKEFMPYMGFPGGKTKAIVVEVPGTAFAGGDYRVRIATSMEIYWDSIQFATDEADDPIELTELEPYAADLHYRGFSRRVPHGGNGPESYLYDEVSQDPVWPPMAGRFTRYGDVTPLVAQSDDLLVVLGAGDEMTVRFKVPTQKIPEGWRRDFILHNVGWDKDANLSTISGHAVEPMPFRAMTHYPSSDLGPMESPAYRQYLEKYQTRAQDFSRFRRQIQRYVPR